MQGIRNIVFDLGGVLLNLDMQKTEDAFTGMGVARFQSAYLRWAMRPLSSRNTKWVSSTMSSL
jgi:FMN phosphatase YigB (HAD superfamily)